VARVTADDLKAMFDRGESPVVLDVRTNAVRKRDPRRIPTAIVASSEDVPQRLGDVPLHQEIVLYCT